MNNDLLVNDEVIFKSMRESNFWNIDIRDGLHLNDTKGKFQGSLELYSKALIKNYLACQTSPTTECAHFW
jgi:hypothetical protein